MTSYCFIFREIQKISSFEGLIIIKAREYWNIDRLSFFRLPLSFIGVYILQ